MKAFNTRSIAAALLVTLLASAAYANPRAGQQQKTVEAELASVPGLSQAQRDDIIRIENENHEAHRALMKSTRSEHERLRDQATSQLRAALGDKAYADYVTWKLEQPRQHRGRGHRGNRDGRQGTRKEHRPAPCDADETMPSTSAE